MVKFIIIEIEGGVVQDVHGLPKGWVYEIKDHDLIKGVREE